MLLAYTAASDAVSDMSGPDSIIKATRIRKIEHRLTTINHLADILATYNFARRLKILTPYEYICQLWTSESDRFIVNPIHQMPGLNSWALIFKEEIS